LIISGICFVTQESPVSSPDRRKVMTGALAVVFSARVVLVPQKAAAQTGIVTLRAAPAKRRLRPEPAAETDVWAYNGETPGPVIRVKRGQTSTIRLVNDLPQPTSLHIHGLRHANIMDGVAGLTQTAIEPGNSFDYQITPPDAGTSIYHPLIPGKTAEQVERGLTGLFVVEDDNPIPVELDLAVLLDDWRLNGDNQIEGGFNSASDTARLGRLGNTLTVNGRPGPQEIVLRPRSRVRLRIAGTMNARIVPMRFEKMAKATVIAIDGQPCEAFDPLKRLVIVAPGSRYEIILDLPEKAGEETLVIVSLGDGFTLVRFKTEGEPLAERGPVPELPANSQLPAGIRLQDARRAELTISGGWDIADPAGPGAGAEIITAKFPDPAKIWTLNYGLPSGIGGKPLFSVKKGNVVVIALTNRSAWTQVLTTHGHVFRVLHALDDGWEPFFLDTVILPENRTIRIALIADNPGKWLIRSAILEHMEGGVLSWFEVTS
jgi:FtsP/CotA-like multicopper oxidase with cupredoxin domain